MATYPDDPDRRLADLVGEGASPVLLALDQMPIPIWIVDLKGRIQWMNLAAKGLFGDSIGSHFSRLIAPERVNETRELFARKILGSLQATRRTTVLTAVAGRVRAEVMSVPLRAHGEVLGVMTVARADGTEESPAVDSAAQPPLTPRQHEVLELLATGLSTKRIAAQLGIAEETTRNHIRMLLRELGVHSRLEAVVLAFRSGRL